MSLIALQTNIFAIENLEQLTAEYRLYRIKGLRPEQPEYYQNRQYLTKRLSYMLKSPVLTIQRGDETFLVVRGDVQNLPEAYALVRQRVRFELASDVMHVDFTYRSPQNDEICIRFLQFAIQEALFQHPSLWQPASGRPFFEYRPQRIDGDTCHFRGFSVRVTPTPAHGLGLVVDVTTKSVGRRPLPAQLSRQTFGPWQSKNVIYHYSYQWYEIQIAALDDRTCGEYEVDDQGKWLSLRDFAIRKSRKPIPQELEAVRPEDNVVLYRNNQNEDRAAIARLCYPVLGTDSNEATASLHRENILPPHVRRSAILTFAQTYLPLVRLCLTVVTVWPTDQSVAASPWSAARVASAVPSAAVARGTITTPGPTSNDR